MSSIINRHTGDARFASVGGIIKSFGPSKRQDEYLCVFMRCCARVVYGPDWDQAKERIGRELSIDDVNSSEIMVSTQNIEPNSGRFHAIGMFAAALIQVCPGFTVDIYASTRQQQLRLTGIILHYMRQLAYTRGDHGCITLMHTGSAPSSAAVYMQSINWNGVKFASMVIVVPPTSSQFFLKTIVPMLGFRNQIVSCVFV